MSGLAHWWLSIQQVLLRMRQDWRNTLFICFTIAITLALPCLFYLLLNSLNSLTGQLKTESKMSVFMAANTQQEAIQATQQSISNLSLVASVAFISKQEAFKNLMASGQYGGTLEALEENPLPDAFVVTPKSLDETNITELSNALRQLPQVAEVIVDDSWLKRLRYLLALGQQGLWALAALFGFGLFAVVGNIIRLQFLNQRDEIELNQLIGATQSFIRRPFLIAGGLYGLLGGVMAIAICCSVLLWFNSSVAKLAAEYYAQFTLQHPSVGLSLIVCGLGALLGLFSAFFSVQKLLLKNR